MSLIAIDSHVHFHSTSGAIEALSIANEKLAGNVGRIGVVMLAERQGYIEQAGAIKGERSAVRDDARIEEVVQKVLAEADRAGLSRSIAEPLWRLLIEKSIEHEFSVFDGKKKSAANG